MRILPSGDGSSLAKQRELHQLLVQHRRDCPIDLDRAFPFSWARTALFFMSCFLLLSDVLRAGLGVRSFAPNYIRVEPDNFVHFGPFGYPVITVNASQTNADQHGTWIYKYDSTSVALRAFADIFGISAWPPCMQYQTTCFNGTIGFATIFDMLDAVVDAIAGTHAGGPVTTTITTHRQAISPVSLTARVKYQWLDRFQHYVLPEFFYTPVFRTSRALYFSPTLLPHYAQRGFCAAARAFRPSSCSDTWLNWKRTRLLRNDTSEVHGDVWSDTTKRVHKFLTQYPPELFQVDMLLLDSSDDATKSGISFRGRRCFDVVTILRARKCDNTTDSETNATRSCSTVVIDDYRYEGGMETTDVLQWYNIVATLRFIGQLYMWLRIGMLLAGCYFARSTEPRFALESLPRRWYIATRTMLMIPSQVIIYSSAFPIGSYVLAHLIDSPMTYEIIGERYPTTLGQLKIPFGEFVRLSAVLMRNVWVFGVLLHVFIAVYTQRSWTWTDGVIGICELTISVTSALTTIAHYRSVVIRNSNVLTAIVQPDNIDVAVLKARRFQNISHFFDSIFVGQLIDLKMLLASLSVVSVAALIIGLLLRHCLRWKTRTIIWTRSYVHFGARELWPLNALAVGWNGNFIIEEPRRTVVGRLTMNITNPNLAHHQSSQRSRRRALSLPDSRTYEDNSLVLLMNLCMVTDPLTLWRLRMSPGAGMAFVRSQATGRTYILPHSVFLEQLDNTDLPWYKMELLCVLNSQDLPWSDFLSCG